jgi:hypothetical protein
LFNSILFKSQPSSTTQIFSTQLKFIPLNSKNNIKIIFLFKKKKTEEKNFFLRDNRATLKQILRMAQPPPFDSEVAEPPPNVSGMADPALGGGQATSEQFRGWPKSFGGSLAFGGGSATPKRFRGWFGHPHTFGGGPATSRGGFKPPTIFFF